MAINQAAVTCKNPIFFGSVGFSRELTSQLARRAQIPLNSVKITDFMMRSSCSLSSVHGISVRNFGASKTGMGRLRLGSFLLQATSDIGSGQGGGFGGGSGDENSGGGGDGGGGSEGDSGSSWSLLSWYLALLASYPVLTKAVTSAVLTLVGDVICQICIDQAPSLDTKRTLLFTLLGLVLVGPTLHFWYLYLSKLVTMSGVKGTFLRLVLDQFGFAPLFIGVFLSCLLTLEGRASEVVPKLQQEWFSSVLANWQLWLPFQFLNFRFVPQQFQVLAANVVSLVWNVILSFKAHKQVVTK